MSKKLALCALTAISTAILALPTAAFAEDIPLHLNPTPEGTRAVTGGVWKFSTTSGLTLTCNEVSGTATFENGGTTGTIELTVKGDCRENVFGTTCNSEGQASGTITTTTLPFHLLTLPSEKPGMLITPGSGGSGKHFATLKCAGGTVTTAIEGSGLIGTVTAPACGSSATSMTISFKATADGQQEHKKVAGTETIYDLTSGGNTAAVETTLTIAMGTSTKVECT